jgi:TPR repeat protein
MRTYDVAVTVGLIGLAIGLSPAASFDGTRTPEMAPVTAAPVPAPAIGGGAAPVGNMPVAPLPRAVPPGQSPFDAFRSGTQALRDGKTSQGVTALEYAAEQGVPGAMWKLGRIYADGDGVDQNRLRAFEHFRNLTKKHANVPPGTPQARFVANAFVTLGHFYLDGIPDSEVKADPEVAYRMFRYAASYFGDGDAQYHLGRMYLRGEGTPKNGLQAARWLRLAADKGHRNAQALLGGMLFRGTDVPRQAAMGLFWLTVAKDGARPDEKWISDTYLSANKQATDEERAIAYSYLVRWMNSRRGTAPGSSATR